MPSSSPSPKAYLHLHHERSKNSLPRVCYFFAFLVFLSISVILVKETSIYNSNSGSSGSSSTGSVNILGVDRAIPHSISSFFLFLSPILSKSKLSPPSSPETRAEDYLHPMIDDDIVQTDNGEQISITSSEKANINANKDKNKSKRQQHSTHKNKKTGSTFQTTRTTEHHGTHGGTAVQKDRSFGPRFYPLMHLSKLRKYEQKFTSRNVIIGYVEDIDVAYLTIFAASLRKSSNKTTEVIIFISELNVNSRVVKIAKEFAIRFVYFSRMHLGQTGASNLKAFHPSSLRYVLFACLLTNRDCNFKTDLDYNFGMEKNTWLVHNFDNVLLVDIRDSFFQDDPFKLCAPSVRSKTEMKRIKVTISPTTAPSRAGNETLTATISNSNISSNSNSVMSRAVINKPHFETSTISSKWVYQNSVTEYYVPNLCKDTFYSGKETLSGKLGTSGFNSNFIKSCFSDTMLSLLKNQEISCSAVSLGDSVKVSQYIYLMANVLTGKSQVLSIDPKCPEIVGVDQGIHNLILALGTIKNAKLIAEFIDVNAKDRVGSPFINLLGSETHRYHYEKDEKVTKIQNFHLEFSQEKNREVFPLVHEYDRVFSLHKHLISMYAPWVNVNNNSLTDIEIEPACVFFNISARSEDPLAGKYDLSSKIAMTASQCCTLCNNQRMNWLRKINSIKTYRDYEQILTPIEQQILAGNLNKLSNGKIRMNKHSRKFYMTHSERFKICTSFTFVENFCYMKFPSFENASAASIAYEKKYAPKLELLSKENENENGVGEKDDEKEKLSSGGGGHLGLTVNKSLSVSESQNIFTALAASQRKTNNDSIEKKPPLKVISANLKLSFFA